MARNSSTKFKNKGLKKESTVQRRLKYETGCKLVHTPGNAQRRGDTAMARRKIRTALRIDDRANNPLHSGEATKRDAIRVMSGKSVVTSQVHPA